MSSVTKRPNGRWQATVREPGGRRISTTRPTQRAAHDWATYMEYRFAAGDHVRDAVAAVRQALAEDAREHAALDQPLGDWVEVPRSALAVILPHVEREA